jgi:hypothetical protein
MSLQKESKLSRNSAEFHAKSKCALGPRLNSFPKLKRDSVFRNADESQSHQDSQKEKRARPLTLRYSSNSRGSVSLGGGATVVVGSNTMKNLDH